MATVIVEQFNPRTNCWNKLYEVDADEFDSKAPFRVDKYGGAYRTRTVGEVVKKKPKRVSYSSKYFAPKKRA